MKLLLILDKHRKRIYEIDTVEEIDELIEEIKSIDESEIKRISPDKLKEINKIITEIFSQVEKKKSEIIESIEKSERNLKGLKAYSK